MLEGTPKKPNRAADAIAAIYRELRRRCDQSRQAVLVRRAERTRFGGRTRMTASQKFGETLFGEAPEAFGIDFGFEEEEPIPDGSRKPYEHQKLILGTYRIA
jgi:hypothetical protein